MAPTFLCLQIHCIFRKYVKIYRAMQMQSCWMLPPSPLCLIPFTVFYMPWVPSIILGPRSPFTSPKCTYVCGAIGQFRQKERTIANVHAVCFESLCCALPQSMVGLLKAGSGEKCFSVLSLGRAGCRARRFSCHLRLGAGTVKATKKDNWGSRPQCLLWPL